MKKLYKLLLGTIGAILPLSYHPGGKFGKKFRYICAKHIGAEVGKDCLIETGAYLGSDIVLKDYASVGPRCSIGDETIIGSNVMMGPECLIYTSNHNFNKEKLKYEGYTKVKPVVIEDKVWIGARCIILPGVTIGEGSTIGAGSIVTKDIPAYSVAAGNPAKVIKKLI